MKTLPLTREYPPRVYGGAGVHVEKTALEMADAVIAVSQETRTDVLRLFDVDREKVTVIYNGIDI